MNAMSREGRNPRLELWEEPGILTHKIYTEEYGVYFNKYHTPLDIAVRDRPSVPLNSVTQVTPGLCLLGTPQVFKLVSRIKAAVHAQTYQAAQVCTRP